VRAVIVAVVVVGFVAFSSYIYINTTNISSTVSSNLSQNSSTSPLDNYGQNSTTFTTQSSDQNTTTLPQATETKQSLTTTITPPMVTGQTTQEPPTSQDFGDDIFEPPSAVLVPANTLVWTNFQLGGVSDYTNAMVAGTIHFYLFPEVLGANITVAVYVNGNLTVNSTTPVPDNVYVTNSSLVPPSNSANNSIFALTGVTLQGGVGTETDSSVNLNGATITIAIISDKSLWLAGWTQDDMSKGIGPEFGQSPGQLASTYEAPEMGTINLPPNSLPQPTTTLSFELQISGGLSP
jgi:hypothetical protein